MTQKIKQPKIRYGRKDDSSLHEFYWQVRREREAKGLPPPEEDTFDPKKVFAEWRRENARPKLSGSRKISSNGNKRLLRQFTISIEQTPEHGYWAYCPAVNGKRLYGETMTEAWEKMAAYLGHRLEKLVAKGKPLPKRNARMKK